MSERFFSKNEFACDLSSNYSQSNSNPEIAENCKFRDNFQELQQQEGNHRDAKHMFIRGWMQTINLTIGCIVLGVIIYRQTRQK